MRPERWCSRGACEEACSRLGIARGGINGRCPGRDGMIVRSISWWCKHGASHRKNFDTSSLGGRGRASRALWVYPLNRSDLGDAERSGALHCEMIPVRESVRRDRRCPGLYAPDGPLAICCTPGHLQHKQQTSPAVPDTRHPSPVTRCASMDRVNGQGQ
jgi:hypothetical protein